ncbi:cache domain-containing protein, partial [Planctomycetota bacterium]
LLCCWICTMKISLKAKLTMSFLAVILLCGIVTMVAAVRLISNDIIRQAQEKVKNDLNTAWSIYSEETENIRDVIRFTAGRFFLKDGIVTQNKEALGQELDRIRRAESIDVLTLTDAKGIVILRSRNLSVYNDDQAQDAFVKRVVSGQEVVAGTAIIPKEEINKEGMDLAEQVRMQLVPTPMAKSSQHSMQTSGMMIKAAAPVLGRNGVLVGVLYGGRLLNRNNEIVDSVKKIVYQGIRYRGKDIGTATIFQGDVRISTNVIGEDHERAIGTRVSGEVYERVLVQGLPWIDRAFVVNNWYIAAYEPIKDLGGRIIGILYVGILQEKYIDMQKKAMAVFLGITLFATAITLLLSLFLARHILQPVKSLVYASQQWAEGNLTYQVETTGGDELSHLGTLFNRMALSLQQRDDQLREYTGLQIMKSERLATVGQLAAGVAHEINNPLGAVLMYTHLTLEAMEAGDLQRKNLEKVVGEATRCKDIVKGLLDFSRQTDPTVEESDAHEVLHCTLSLVENLVLLQNVKITRHFSTSLPKVMMDVSQIQQVFTNIILNAAEAMDGKGELTVTTRIAPDREAIEIEFTDTGCGIPRENLEKIFDPFFTTKEVGHGTGLGLAVSYGIVARHKGTIDVKSESGKGTTFIIRLPVKADT